MRKESKLKESFAKALDSVIKSMDFFLRVPEVHPTPPERSVYKDMRVLPDSYIPIPRVYFPQSGSKIN